MSWNDGIKLDEVKKNKLKKDIIYITARNCFLLFGYFIVFIYPSIEMLLFDPSAPYFFIVVMLFFIFGVLALDNGLRRLDAVKKNKFYYKEEVISKISIGSRNYHTRIYSLSGEAYFNNRMFFMYKKGEKFLGVRFLDDKTNSFDCIVFMYDPVIYKVKW